MEQVISYVPWIGIAILVLVLFLLLRWFLSLRRVVTPSEVHVVRQGKVTKIYGNVGSLGTGATNEAFGETEKENLDGAEKKNLPAAIADESCGNVYYQMPVWMPFVGVNVSVLPLAIFDISLDGYDAYDVDRVPFVVDIKAFFRISNYRQAASRISDNDTLVEHLQGIVQGAVRTILAKQKLDDIMSERSTYGDRFTEEVKEQLKHWGVEAVKNIELMDIRDAEGEKVIFNIMQKKKSEIEKDSRIEVANNNRAAEEAEISAEQEIALKKEEKEEKIGKRKAERAEAVGIADEKSKQKVKEQAKITKEKEMEVTKVGTLQQAEIDQQEIIIKANADKDKQKIAAEAEVLVATQKKEAQKIEAEATVLVAEQSEIAAEHDANAAFVKKTKDAEADLVKAKNEAQGIEAKGAAEALAKEKLGQAEVAPQITLAHEIGNNQGYQTYLIEIKKVDASQAVGIEQAKNLGNADIKIIANAGSNVQEGVNSVMQLFSAKGGQAMGGMIEAFAGTEVGQQIVGKILNKESEIPNDDKPKKDKKQ